MNHDTLQCALPELTANFLRSDSCLLDNLFADLCRAVHVRKATRPEPPQQKILGILNLSANPGGTHRAVI